MTMWKTNHKSKAPKVINDQIVETEDDEDKTWEDDVLDLLKLIGKRMDKLEERMAKYEKDQDSRKDIQIKELREEIRHNTAYVQQLLGRLLDKDFTATAYKPDKHGSLSSKSVIAVPSGKTSERTDMSAGPKGKLP